MNENWIERWETGKTGWHEPDGNQNLKTHWQWTGKRVLVPLCGKTPDLLWLESQGNEVVGVEVSELAVESFRRCNIAPRRVLQIGKEDDTFWKVGAEVRDLIDTPHRGCKICWPIGDCDLPDRRPGLFSFRVRSKRQLS